MREPHTIVMGPPPMMLVYSAVPYPYGTAIPLMISLDLCYQHSHVKDMENVSRKPRVR